jgi:hypothetical protein
MNANYIYDIFDITKEKGLPDLNVGLATLQVKKSIPDGMTSKEIREFIGANYDALVEAFKTGDRQTFADVVAACAAETEAEHE